LAFAAHLNRTLVLPPLIEYPPGSREAQMRPFESLFQLAPIFQFHRVVSMEEFMREIAPGLWPTEERKGLKRKIENAL
jgi:peptide-O-fucosyltransferase